MQRGGDLTIIMIAHRLQTIVTAEQLLYLENSSNVLEATKGTEAYNEIIDRLKKTNYAHQVEENEEEEKKESVKASV